MPSPQQPIQSQQTYQPQQNFQPPPQYTTIGGVRYQLNKTEVPDQSSGTSYSKAFRSNMTDKYRMDFNKQVESVQQILFTSTTISVNDPSKLTNHFSLTKTIGECKTSMVKYSIDTVFTIVKPRDFQGPKAGQLKSDDNGNQIAIDLFERYNSVTTDEVAASVRWFRGFGPASARFVEDLQLSQSYFKKNTEPTLYACAYRVMLEFDKHYHGGPLLFKLICNETTTTKDSNRRAMMTIIRTYQIKSSCKGEVITDVADLFKSISDTMSSTYDDKLPKDYVQHIITIFTTTSVPAFNEIFIQLRTNLQSMELQASICNSMITSVGGMNMKNDMNTVNYVLKFARICYSDFVQKGAWDKCLNATPGQSGLLTTNPSDGVSPNYVCFNCGKKADHLKGDCPEDVNKERQKLEREKFLKNRPPKQSAKFNKPRDIPFKWRAPEASEQNKRTIDNKPHTYDPTIKGWREDNTPSSGQPSVNLTPAQIELKELKAENARHIAENERLKTDQSESTPEQSANYARGTQLNTNLFPQALVVVPNLTTQEGIKAEMF